MMTMMPRRLLPAAALLGLLTLPALALAAGNDYPTSQRVLYVQECMSAHPGHYYEMVNKCSCAIDAIAEQVSYDDYVTMTTVVNAMTIGGERGGTLRDNDSIKPEIKRYRELQAKVQKSCFIASSVAASAASK
ncbi:hypothetical protein [Pelomonas sp. KK5]|uniref:hypothetical protein n=1 Tax=Pelomonas sp. KK5 TaxID=1855730 RepID=UPI001E51142F|nr:hypothetical protein [Pelomonas sp. KK5]